ncbi:MAG: hypothetical protein ACE14L_02505 [Terriglobales bacterium]
MQRLLFLIAAALFVAATAGATTVKPLSVEELTRAAGSVVEAQAGDSWSAWNAGHSLIYTYTRFTVFRGLKGGSSIEVIVKQPGGVVGGYAQRVPGVRGFQAGEQAVLFLRPSVDADGTHVVVGLMQGNFRMFPTSSGEMAVSNGAPAAWELTPQGTRVYTGTRMSLQQLESRVRGAQR